jgi:hypothetical protein
MKTTPVHILKRDGETLQSFDVGKLRRALSCAWTSATSAVDERALNKVIVTVLDALSNETVRVEDVQNAVETVLMRQGQFAVAKAFILYRHQRTEVRLARTPKVPDPKAVSDYIHAGKYARYLPEKKRREVYTETVARTEEMHLGVYPEMETEIRWAFDLVRNKRVLPSMRSLQFSGDAILKNNNRIFNCSYSLVDRMEIFSEALYLLLSGCGVGYSVQFDHIERLPSIVYVDFKKVQHHVIQDTIEGWADALKALLQSYLDGVNLEFSYHLIRDAGTPLRTSGGRAPGHLRLKDSLERIRGVLEAAQGRKLRPVECHRIMCHAADAVLSGGIRRSAMICLFSLDDSEMMHIKTGNWFVREPWFSNANNSVVLKRDEVKKKQFKRIFGMTKQWGEPGFFFTHDYDYGTNPCFHPDTRLWTSKGYVRVEDLFKAKGPNLVIRDVRVDKGDIVQGDRRGVQEAQASPVFLTQKNVPVFRLTTEHGYHVTVTASHEFPTLDGRKKLSDLRPGDTLFLPSGEGYFGTRGTLDEGLLLGLFVGDGTSDTDASYIDLWANDFDQKDHVLSALNTVIQKEPTFNEKRSYGSVQWQDQVVPEGGALKVRAGGTRFRRWLTSLADQERLSTLKERVPESVWRGSRDFVVGYLRGFFATDGTVLLGGKGTKATLSLRLTQSNREMLEDIQVLLGMFGVVSRLYYRRPAGLRLLPDNKGLGELKEYFCKETFELVINRPNTITFNQNIGLFGCKAAILSDRMGQRGEALRKPERFITRVLSIEAVGTSDVYCLTQPETNSVIANGIVTAQCAEIGLNPKLTVYAEVQATLASKGIKVALGSVLTGWAFCNLCEINAAKLTSLKDFKEAAKAATIIGTLQAGYTKMPYLGVVSEVIAERDALLGIGMTGMLDAPQIACNPEYQREVAGCIKVWNAEYSARIGINPAARTTCVKPSGTTSLELGCVGPGHHAHHARRYIRRVVADELEPVFQSFKAVNPHMCIRKPDGKWVIEFPVMAPTGAMIKDDITALSFLDMVKSTQLNWVFEGTVNSTHSPGLNHNVSNTVTVRPEEWDKVADYLWENREFFTGVSLLANTGDKDYAYAPQEKISTSADESRWNQLLEHYKPVDYSSILEENDNTDLAGEAACVGGVCMLV